jgi:hypothetical protein
MVEEIITSVFSTRGMFDHFSTEISLGLQGLSTLICCIGCLCIISYISYNSDKKLQFRGIS